jgi:NADPH-dependent ferric siderophore reductase
MFKKSMPRILRVKKAVYLTPNVIRITYGGSELEGLPSGREGGNCKLILPNDGQAHEDFIEQLKFGAKFPVRTYTVRAFRESQLEMDIDFVAHGSTGPASRWAMSAKAGDFCGFMGPSPSKVDRFDADWYLVAADLSAFPLAAVTLESMPRSAKGVAIFEITSPSDKQIVNAPEGVDIHWLIHPEPHRPSIEQESFVRNLSWPDGRVQVCVAGESSIVKLLRKLLIKENGISKTDAYISGYWKIGLVEEEHQKLKRKEAEQ